MSEKLTSLEKLESLFGKAIVQQQGHVKEEKSEGIEGIKENAGELLALLTDIRDDIRLMRLQMESKKEYETKVSGSQLAKQLRYKGQYENTGAMNVPETK